MHPHKSRRPLDTAEPGFYRAPHHQVSPLVKKRVNGKPVKRFDAIPALPPQR